MKYLITTKEEWEDEATSLGCVFNTPEEAVEAATRDWGSRINELIILHVDKVVEVKQSLEFSDYKGQTNE
jgi:hypothetical protein